jgi:hypothetical protein
MFCEKYKEPDSRRTNIVWGLYFEEGVIITTASIIVLIGIVVSIVTGVIVGKRTDMSTGAGWGSLVGALFALVTGSGPLCSNKKDDDESD